LSGRGGYMEIILVYSLLPLFFVILLVFVVLSFLREKDLPKADQFQHDSAPQESKIAYFSLGALFVLLILLAFLKEYDYGRKDGT
jgi:Na+/H+ antiporter NhaD/arsenite permease-like protein